MHSRVSYQRSCDLPRIPLTRRQEYTPREDLIKYVRRPRSELAYTHTHTRVTRRKFSTCVRIPRHSRWLSLRRREEQPPYKLRQFPSLNWRRLDRLEGQSFPNGENTVPSSDFAKVLRREKCIDIYDISMVKTMIRVCVQIRLMSFYIPSRQTTSFSQHDDLFYY